MMMLLHRCMALGMMLLTVAAARGAEATGKVSWSAKDLRGAVVTVPGEGRPTVLVFARFDQPQSQSALDQVTRAAAATKQLHVVVIANGASAEAAGKDALVKQCPWPIVADPQYALSGKMRVRVWPTVVILHADGREAAHLAGMPKSFASHLAAYLAFVSGAIDEAALKAQLARNEIVGPARDVTAGRHLLLTQRMLEEGRGQEAMEAAAEGIRQAPQDVHLQLARVRALLMLKRPGEAMQQLDRVQTPPALRGQVAALKARALIASGQWGAARVVLAESLRLNPDPAEAHYLLGVISQHEHDAAGAAEHFRSAFEATEAGRKAAVARELGGGK